MIRRTTPPTTGNKKKLAPNGFPGETKRICLCGDPKKRVGEKSKEPERKETMTTSKRKGHNKQQQINEYLKRQR